MEYILNLDLVDGPDEYTGIYQKANGGTEMQYRGLMSRLANYPHINEFQIICSRVRKLDPNKKKILWFHDLFNDPENQRLQDKSFQDQFDKFIFVSNHQFQAYHLAFNIPYSKSAVINNSIEPFGKIDKPNPEKVKLIYHTTPHRGLEILVPVFQKMYESDQNIELDIFSSFSVYGWNQRDEPYKELFKVCEEHPAINYHGGVSNDVVREALKNSHIFAYPSIWPETSCIAAIEAMASGNLVVCPDFAALSETVGRRGQVYRFHEDPNHHAISFYLNLQYAIQKIREDAFKSQMNGIRESVENEYSWDSNFPVWVNLLDSLRGQK